MKYPGSVLSVVIISALASQVIAQNVGIGVLSPQNRLHIEGDPNTTLPILYVHNQYPMLADVIGIKSHSVVADGWGIGFDATAGYIGVRSNVVGGTYGGTTYGIYSSASGSAGTRIGLYAQASGGSQNWAGWFAGDTKIQSDLHVDQSIFALNDVDVGGTVITSALSAPVALFAESGRDMFFKIDAVQDPNYAAAFWVRNGDNDEAFGVDENGNARTYGHHYVDDNLGVGTQFPQARLHVQDGSVRVQGIFPTIDINTTGPTLPCGIGFQENGSLEGAVYYEASQNRINMTNTFFNAGLVLDLNTNAVSIGSFGNASGYKLSVDGKVTCEELKVQDSGIWPDYVFDPTYDLKPLSELESAIKQHHHLPGVPSAAEVNENGILVGAMQRMMLEKIEELTLYIIAQDKRIADLERLVSQNPSANK